jgi:amino-acid N-acetyltransferase
MAEVHYEKPKLDAIEQMQALVMPEVQSGKILFRSNDEIATNIRSYTVAKEGDKIVGFAALHIYSPRLAEVRSLIVDASQRGKGVGSQLVRHCIEEGKALGIRQLFALTYEQRFFEKLGFKEIPKESLPEHKIWADCVKCKHFPICDEVALIYNLS